ncbi:MAG: hypothetical protein Kow0092_16560 [Deferrisomatales bacterium]
MKRRVRGGIAAVAVAAALGLPGAVTLGFAGEGQAVVGGGSASPAGLLPQEECGPEGASPCPSGGKAKAGGVTAQEARAALLPVGAPAVGFTLSDAAGQRVEFAAENGMRPALLIFWSMFCEPCREELPAFGRIAHQYADRLQTLSINLDGPRLGRAVTRYMELNGIDFPVVLDEKVGPVFLTAQTYGVTGTPSLFLVGADGSIRWNHAGRLDPAVLDQEIRLLLEP